METNKNLLIAMQVVKDECIKHGKCEDCPVWEHLDDICEPHHWRIPKETEEEQMNVKLKPCPFCGSDKAMIDEYKTLVGERYKVVCPGCMATVDPGDAQTDKHAAKAWNRRAEMKRVIHAEV